MVYHFTDQPKLSTARTNYGIVGSRPVTPITFRCNINANPTVNLSDQYWMRDGVKLVVKENKYRVEKSLSNTSLTIFHTNLDDRGNYKCVVQNGRIFKLEF